MSSSLIKHVTDATFEADVIQSDTPVLVDFWATWCGPCRAIAPMIDELATAYAGKLTVVKVDVDANPDTPAKLGVRGIPTLVLYKGGEVMATKVGALSKSQLTEVIEQHV